MSNIHRIKKIQEKLKIGSKREPIEYVVHLIVEKYKTFEETFSPAGFNNAWSNGMALVMQGKRFIGQINYKDKPKVEKKLKEIYSVVQKDLLNDPKSSTSLMWVFLKENDNGELELKKS